MIKNTKKVMSSKKSKAVATPKKTTTPKIAAAMTTPSNTPAAPLSGSAGFQMPPEPSRIAAGVQSAFAPIAHPLVPMSPGMISSIRKAPTGKIPNGLSKWMAAHGKMVK